MPLQDFSTHAQLRVALVSGCLKLGGSTTFLCNLGGELTRRKIPVEVWSFEQENPLGADFDRLGVRVHTQDERKFIYEDRLAAILAELTTFQPTCVVGCLASVSFEVFRYLPTGIFRIGMVQSHDPGVYQMVKFYGPHLDAMAAVSDTIKQTLASMPEFAHTRIEYLPYGVPMSENKRELAFPPARPLRILYLGRLEQEQKRVRIFPEVLAQLNASGIPFHWTVAGEGPDRSFLQSAMQSAPNQTVSFPGKILYGDVPKILSEHEVFLLASDYEGLPLSLLEAMGCGLVPVVSDLGSGIREVVDDSTGKRVGVADIEGYARAIIWLHQNRGEMERMAANGRSRVLKEFSVPAMTDRWLKVFPQTFPPGIQWAPSGSITAPLPAETNIRFSVAGKLLRRLVFKLRR
jgi:glycosyltransferase involved in cell wall biosynthesis